MCDEENAVPVESVLAPAVSRIGVAENPHPSSNRLFTQHLFDAPELVPKAYSYSNAAF